MVIIVFGLPGSGKSYFSKVLSTKLNATYINSDTIRDKFPKPSSYSRQEKNIVYDMILKKMLTSVHADNTVVIDATFYKEDLRRRFSSYIPEPGMLHFIEIVADELLIKNRLSARRDSTADYDVYKLVRAEWEPALFHHLTLRSTDDNINEMIAKALEYLRVHQLSATLTEKPEG